MAKTKVVRGLCTVDGCTRAHKARGYCAVHYQHYLRGVPVRAEIKTRDRTVYEHCSEEGCQDPVKARGLCMAHYARLLRHGHTRFHDRKRPAKQCSVAACENHVYAKGMCHQHYIRQRGLSKNYGLSLEDEARMLVEQGGVCAICSGYRRSTNGLSGKTMDFHLDHDHATGSVRGLLCDQCNRGIGLLGDDTVTLATALSYLAKHALSPLTVLDAAISTLQQARCAYVT